MNAAPEAAPLRPHELRVLELLLAGRHTALAALRAQLAGAGVVKRAHTGAGEYVELEVRGTHERSVPASFVLDDVELTVKGVPHGAAALLFVREGKLDLLEFATTPGEWPLDPHIVAVSYLKAVETSPGNHALEPRGERDDARLELAISGHRTSNAT